MHLCVDFCVNLNFQIIGCIPKSVSPGSYFKSLLNFVKKCQCLVRWLSFCISISNKWECLLLNHILVGIWWCQGFRFYCSWSHKNSQSDSLFCITDELLHLYLFWLLLFILLCIFCLCPTFSMDPFYFLLGSCWIDAFGVCLCVHMFYILSSHFSDLELLVLWLFFDIYSIYLKCKVEW